MPLQAPPLVARAAGSLAKSPVRDATPNPAALYVITCAEGSRPALRSTLRTVGALLLGHRPSWEETAEMPWWEVRYRHVEIIRARLRDGPPSFAPATVNRALSVLRSVLAVAWKNGQMSTDDYQRAVAVEGVGKDSAKAGRLLEPAEIVSLLRACEELPAPRNAQAAAILATMYGAGLRRIEIARGVAPDAVDLEEGALRVLGKRGKTRTAHIAPGWIRYLRAWVAVRPPRAAAFFGTLSVTTVATIVEEVRSRAGVEPFTPHDLRRSFGSHLLDKVDISLVRDLMGHSDVRTTLLYDRRGEGKRKQAVALLDLPDVK